MTWRLLRFHDTQTDRVWFAVAQDDAAAEMLAATALEQFNPGPVLYLVICAVELDVSADRLVPWTTGDVSIYMPGDAGEILRATKKREASS